MSRLVLLIVVDSASSLELLTTSSKTIGFAIEKSRKTSRRMKKEKEILNFFVLFVVQRRGCALEFDCVFNTGELRTRKLRIQMK